MEWYPPQASQLETNWIGQTNQSEPMSLSLPAPLKKLKEVHYGDRVFLWLLKTISFMGVLVLFSIGIFLLSAAFPSLKQFGWSFLVQKVWNPVAEEYSALPVIFGTLVSSFLAVIIATPVSIGVALFLNELSPRFLATPVAFLVEMLAAIPSVVYGLWGVFVLTPWLRSTLQPLLGNAFGFLPMFQGPFFGVGLFAGGMILAIMIVPTVASITREVFKAIPRSQKEAALGLGATRWEMMKLAILKSAKPGILGAVIIGLGRAIGETMAVTMVIGNRFEIPSTLFAPAQTMSSIIANQYAEASSELQRSALAEIGLLLFVVSLVVNGVARFFVWRVTHKTKGGR